MSEEGQEVSRLYTVPLAKAWLSPKKRRTVRAMNMIKEFTKRHMKATDIKITTGVNESMWGRGIEKPPRRITLLMEKDVEGVVTVSLPPT
ncbi:MAG: 50S ribosomal protein L31e [Nitrososphaerales archaeon]